MKTLDLPWLTMVLAAAMSALYLFHGPADPTWVYRADLLFEQPRRWLSGHWVHGDVQHLGWNLVALLLLGTLLEREGRSLLIAGLLVGSLFVSLCLWAITPGLLAYCGLSGVLNTLWVLVLYRQWRHRRSWWLPCLALISLAKILYEWQLGLAVFSETLWPAVPEAHLAGWLAGCMVAVATRRRVAPFDTAKGVSRDLLRRPVEGENKPLSWPTSPTTTKGL